MATDVLNIAFKDATRGHKVMVLQWGNGGQFTALFLNDEEIITFTGGTALTDAINCAKAIVIGLGAYH